MNSKGTPKTLDEAILNGLLNATGRPADEAVKVIQGHVTDFLNQHFTSAYMRVDLEHWSTKDVLNQLAYKIGLKVPEGTKEKKS